MPSFLEVVDAVRTAMPGVTHLVGVEHMTGQTTRPGTVVWVPNTDAYGPPPPPSIPQPRTAPRARWQRVESVQVACWGKGTGRVSSAEDDMKAALELATAVLFAVEDALNGSFRVSSGSWEANAPKAQMGRWYVLALEFDAPVTRSVATATVTAVETEAELADASE